jgi:hypothetical protein
VWVKFDGLDSIERPGGADRRVRRPRIEFARPLYPPVFDALVARLA